MSKIKALVCLTILASFSNCGGGGGSSQPFFGGVWRGTQVLAENNCPTSFPLSIQANWTVNQSERTVVLDTDTGLHFDGKLQDDSKGFTVVHVLDSNDTCTSGFGINFQNLKGDKADSTFAALLTCPGVNLECSAFYVGEVTRD